MPPVDRKNPIRAASSESSHSVMEFMREFHDDEACLQWLWRSRFSEDGEHAWCDKCRKRRTFRRYVTTPRTQTWTCTSCTHKISPTAGTIFHKSSTSLHLWFYAMWIITSTRCGVSAKQLERELGVTYKTAWRMFNLIRNRLMGDEEKEQLSGIVEVDETYVGAKNKRGTPRGRPGYGSHKTAVFGAVERGGRVVARVIPDSTAATLRGSIQTHVLPKSTIFTDEYQPYRRITRDGYYHRRVNHSQDIYVSGEVHTNTIEGFFSLVKSGLRGSYHSVSRKWLQGYLNEYAWRYNHRDDEAAMFKTLLLRATVS